MDLQKQTALPISLNEKGILEFGAPLEKIEPGRRTVAQMKEYLFKSEASFPTESVYDMYRNVHLPQDEKTFTDAGLRFDITVFHPGLLGNEFCKTIGHYHPYKPATRVRYPETYEVICGQALFLMQRMDEAFEKVLEVYAIEASEGEDVIFLPGFAHFTINPTPQILVTSNWVARAFESNYARVAKYHGAAYYVLRGADGKPEFIPNKNYSFVPELKKLRPKELPQLGLINNQPAYLTGQKSPNMLKFLITPEDSLNELKIEHCYLELPL